MHRTQYYNLLVSVADSGSVKRGGAPRGGGDFLVSFSQFRELFAKIGGGGAAADPPLRSVNDSLYGNSVIVVILL